MLKSIWGRWCSPNDLNVDHNDWSSLTNRSQFSVHHSANADHNRHNYATIIIAIIALIVMIQTSQSSVGAFTTPFFVLFLAVSTCVTFINGLCILNINMMMTIIPSQMEVLHRNVTLLDAHRYKKIKGGLSRVCGADQTKRRPSWLQRSDW